MPKKYFIIFLVIYCPFFLFPQNVGIGTSSPTTLEDDQILDLMSDYVSFGSIIQLSKKDRDNYLRLFSGKSGEGPFIWWNEVDDLRLVTDEGFYSEKIILRSNGNLDMRAHKVKDFADPVDTQDEATKAYFDFLENTVASPEAEGALKGVKDIDNNRYDIVTIGTQTWMAENLKTTRYNDGTVIPFVTDKVDWITAYANGADAYCWYDNDSSSLITYGALYNWYVIDTSSNDNKNVCPIGWHIPTDGEWDILRDHLDPAASGNNNIAGGKMKEAGLVHWISPNKGATNDSGFAGLPGGLRNNIGSFFSNGYFGYWWSSTGLNTSDAYDRGLYYSLDSVGRNEGNKGSGLSVRCLRD